MEIITETSPLNLCSTPNETISVGPGAGKGKGGGTGGNSGTATCGLSLGAMSSKCTGKSASLLSSLFRGVTLLRGVPVELDFTTRAELDELPALASASLFLC